MYPLFRKISIYLALLCVTAPVYGFDALEANRNGVAAMKAGRYDEAIRIFTEVLRQSKDDPTAKASLVNLYNGLGLGYDEAGDHAKAREMLDKALKLAPDSANIKRNLAVLCYNEGFRRYNRRKGEDVVGPLRESIGFDSSIAQTRVLLGQAYYDADDYRQAKEQWEAALAIDPKHTLVKEKLDKLNKELGKDDRLREQYRLHFKVRYEGEVGWDYSQDVLNILEDAYREIGQKLSFFPQEPLTVVIYTQQDFQSVTGMTDWYAGAYDGKIRLRQGDVMGDKTRLRQIVFHEYAHALIHCLAGNRVPIWLNEGIAQCYENIPQRVFILPSERMAVIRQLGWGLPDMDRVDANFLARASENDVRFAYAFSKGFVAFLIDKGWDYSLKNLLVELNNGAALDAAFMRVYFRDLRQMRDDWINDLKYNKG